MRDDEDPAETLRSAGRTVLKARSAARGRRAQPPPGYGYWIEEYKGCGCSLVARRRDELVGYCSKHGNNRQSTPYRMPEAAPVGMA